MNIFWRILIGMSRMWRKKKARKKDAELMEDPFGEKRGKFRYGEFGARLREIKRGCEERVNKKKKRKEKRRKRKRRKEEEEKRRRRRRIMRIVMGIMKWFLMKRKVKIKRKKKMIR